MGANCVQTNQYKTGIPLILDGESTTPKVDLYRLRELKSIVISWHDDEEQYTLVILLKEE